jgi:two-component system OmpR family sensor kinase
MRKQFIRLYLMGFLCLVALLVIFGQAYNQFFAATDAPSINLTSKQIVELITTPSEQVKLSEHDIVLSSTLKQQLQTQGFLALELEAGAISYLISHKQNLYQIGPFKKPQGQAHNAVFFTFYIVLALLFLAFLRPIFNDLTRLQRGAEAFAKTQQATPIAVSPNSSIAPLVTSFNQMASRITEFVQLHQDLSRIISHEIRTPLSRLRFALSLQSDLTQKDKINQAISDIEARLAQYLQFARVEHSINQSAQSQFSAEEFIKARIEPFTQRDLVFDITTLAPTLNAEASTLAIAIDNLIGNAAKFANHTISVAVSENHSHYFIKVADDGDGLPANADSLLNAFEHGEQLASGYGLGLYIVKRVMDWHKGDIKLTASGHLGGAEITIFWPKPVVA